MSLPFRILQRVKSLSFHMPEAQKRGPFRAGPPRTGHYRQYPPPPPGTGYAWLPSEIDQNVVMF